MVLQNRVEEWIKDWRLSPAESRDLYLDTAALLRTNKVLHSTAPAIQQLVKMLVVQLKAEAEGETTFGVGGKGSWRKGWT